MIKTIRAAIASMFVLAFAVVGLSTISAGAEASSPRIASRGNNYALTGKVETNIPEKAGEENLWYWDSCANDGAGGWRDSLANLNDGKITHEAKDGGYDGENRFQLNKNVSETKTLMGGVDPYIQIVWETPVTSVNNVYIAQHQNDWVLTEAKIQCKKADGDWKDVSNPRYETGECVHTGDLDIYFDSVENIVGIRVVMLKSNNSPNLSEIEVFNRTAWQYVTSDLEAAIAKGDALVNANYSVTSWNTMTDALASAKNAFDLCSGKNIGAVESIKTQDALDAYTNALVTAINSLDINHANKFLGAATLYWNTNTVAENINGGEHAAIHECDDISAATMTDGVYNSTANSWCPWWTAAEDRFYLVFDNAVDVETLRIVGEHAGYEFEISYLTRDDFADAENVTWDSLEEAFANASIITCETNTIASDNRYFYDCSFDTVSNVKVLGIKVKTHHLNGIGLPDSRIFEVEGYKAIGDGVVKAETAVVDGVKSVFVATNVAETDVPAGASITVEFFFELADGTFVEGEKVITAAYTSIALGEQTVTATDITGADSNDYVTGILFVNVPESVNVNDIVVNFYVAE